jgi:hypothetical protein
MRHLSGKSQEKSQFHHIALAAVLCNPPALESQQWFLGEPGAGADRRE